MYLIDILTQYTQLLGTNSIRQIMRHCHKPGLSQYRVEQVAANARVTIMCLRTVHSQSDVSVNTLQMST